MGSTLTLRRGDTHVIHLGPGDYGVNHGHLRVNHDLHPSETLTRANAYQLSSCSQGGATLSTCGRLPEPSVERPAYLANALYAPIARI